MNTKNTETKTEKREIKMDDKVRIRSIAPWITGAKRIASIGDINIIPKGTALLSREEVIAQAQNGNRLLTGTDGHGAHATWIIEDEWTRNEVEFTGQKVLDKAEVQRLFNLKSQKQFEDQVREAAVTRAERAMLMEYIKLLGVNDYHKIRFCERYTGLKFAAQ